MGKKTIELLIIFTENVTLLQASTLWLKENSQTQLRKQFYSQARGNRACRTTFGGASPASEALLVVKQPKQFQLQDVFNIFLSISDLFPSSLDYTSQEVLLCYHVTYSMPPFLNSPLTSSDNYWLYIFLELQWVSFRNNLGCVPFGWSGSGSVIQDLSGSWCIRKGTG